MNTSINILHCLLTTKRLIVNAKEVLLLINVILLLYNYTDKMKHERWLLRKFAYITNSYY